MAKRLDWGKRNKKEKVKQTQVIDELHRILESSHNDVVAQFFNHVEHYKKLGIPAPEFKVPDYY